jgi:dephospho-CoA kinase
VQRLLQRGMTREEALRRIDSQMPAMEKAKRSDRVIITTGDKADNANHVIRLWDALLRRI